MTRLSTLLVAVLIAFSSSAYAGERYIIGFKPEASAAQRASALTALGASSIEALDELEVVAADVPQTAVAALDETTLDSLGLLFVEEDFEINWLLGAGAAWPTMSEIRQAVPPFQRKTAPQNQIPEGVDAAEVPWGVRRVNAAAAWATTEGQGARVAVIDTGIDANHPDLRGQVAGGYNAVDSKAPYFDDNKHGTHVAGTIAALRDGQGVVGVAPKARLFAVKVLDKDGRGHLSSIIKGIVWCARNDIHVANMSLGSPMGTIFMRLAVNYATRKGVTIVAAAGNSSGAVGCPACYPGVIAVSASNKSDNIADFSSRGKKVAFIAPGVDVPSTIPNGEYKEFSGTSMATPHVAGLAALAVSRGAKGPDAVRSKLEGAAKSIGLDQKLQGRGMIDAAALVR